MYFKIIKSVILSCILAYIFLFIFQSLLNEGDVVPTIMGIACMSTTIFCTYITLDEIRKISK